jgi:hypothetical protein
VLILGPWGVGKSFLLQLLANRTTKHQLFSADLGFREALGRLFFQNPLRLLFVLVSFDGIVRAQTDEQKAQKAQEMAERIFETLLKSILEGLAEALRDTNGGAIDMAFGEHTRSVVSQFSQSYQRKYQLNSMALWPLLEDSLRVRGPSGAGQTDADPDPPPLTGLRQDRAAPVDPTTEQKFYAELVMSLVRRFHGDPPIGHSRDRLRLVFLIDDFDMVATALSHEQYDALSDMLRYASMVITSSEPLSRVVPVTRSSSPFFGLLQHLTNVYSLFFLTKDEARRLIKQPPTWEPESEGFAFSEKDIDFLLELTGLHEEIIRSVCEFLYNWYQRADDSGEHKLPEHMRPVFRRVLRRPVDATFTRLWSQMRDEGDRQILRVVASGEWDDERMLDRPDFARLVELNFITYRDGRFYLFSKLFEDFVRERPAEALADTLREEPTALDSLDRDLASKERELLRLLRQQRGSVATRPLIASVLYPDDNAAKVIDSGRLEALASRLRGKLKDHGYDVQNVRGEGYRLVQLATDLDNR